MTTEEALTAWLNAALDCGMSEAEFWDSTLAEVERRIESWRRHLQQQAMMDYIQASLIVKGVSVVLGGGNFPAFEEAYSSFCAESHNEAEQKISASAERFIAFANAFNERSV